MQLHELTKSQGRAGKKIIVGRGNSSRRGNYCGKGLKGQTSRSGGSIPEWFEGGQTPLHMRLPKLRGFKRYFKLLDKATPVNIKRLNDDEKIKDGAKITPAFLVEHGYVRKVTDSIKILGSAKITKKLQFAEISAFSKGAVTSIEKAGGSTGITAA